VKIPDLVLHVENSLSFAEKEESRLQETQVGREILKMYGMSGKKWRHFLNNLASFSGCNWLEVGTWAGSTFCSTICGNTEMGYACTFDNSSEFSDVSSQANIAINLTKEHSGLKNVNIFQVKDDFSKFSKQGSKRNSCR